jgi:hypothetical protein
MSVQQVPSLFCLWHFPQSPLYFPHKGKKKENGFLGILGLKLKNKQLKNILWQTN